MRIPKFGEMNRLFITAEFGLRWDRPLRQHPCLASPKVALPRVAEESPQFARLRDFYRNL